MSNPIHMRNHRLIDSSLLIVRALRKDIYIFIVPDLAMEKNNSCGYKPILLGNVGLCEAPCSSSPCSYTRTE